MQNPGKTKTPLLCPKTIKAVKQKSHESIVSRKSENDLLMGEVLDMLVGFRPCATADDWEALHASLDEYAASLIATPHPGEHEGDVIQEATWGEEG